VRRGSSIMVKRKQYPKQETKADAIDKLFREVDPIMLAGATAAGIAGACGVKGPLTTILTGLSGNDVNAQLNNPAVTVGSVFTIGLIPTLVAGLLSGQGTSGTPSPEASQMASLGAAMSNVCEFMIVYAAATNPGTPEAVAKMVEALGSSLKGLGGIVPV